MFNTNQTKIIENPTAFLPDFTKLFNDKIDVSVLTKHPQYFDAFLIPGEENCEKLNEKLERILSDHKISEKLSKTEIQQEVLNDFHAFPVHSYLICYASKQICMSFSHQETNETKFGLCPLYFDDPENILPEILKFLYTNKITLNDQNGLGVMVLSQRLMIDILQKNAMEYLKNSISLSNALQLVEKFLKYPEGCEIFNNNNNNSNLEEKASNSTSTIPSPPIKKISDNSTILCNSAKFVEILTNFCSDHLQDFFYSKPQKKILGTFPFHLFMGILKSSKIYARRAHLTMTSNMLFYYLKKKNCFCEEKEEWKLTVEEQVTIIENLGLLESKKVIPLLKKAYSLEKEEKIDRNLFSKMLKSAELHFSALFDPKPTSNEQGSQEISPFSFMNHEDFLNFLKSEQLNVKDEKHVFTAVQSFLNSKETSEEKQKELKKCVNLNFFSNKDLQSIFYDDIFDPVELFMCACDNVLDVFKLRKSQLKNLFIPMTEQDLQKVTDVILCEFAGFQGNLNRKPNCNFDDTELQIGSSTTLINQSTFSNPGTSPFQTDSFASMLFKTIDINSKSIEFLKKNAIIFKPQLISIEESNDNIQFSPPLIDYHIYWIGMYAWQIAFVLPGNEQFLNSKEIIYGMQIQINCEMSDVKVFLKNYPEDFNFIEGIENIPEDELVFSTHPYYSTKISPLNQFWCFKKPFLKKESHVCVCQIKFCGKEFDISKIFSWFFPATQNGSFSNKTVIRRRHGSEEFTKHISNSPFVPEVKLLTNATKYTAIGYIKNKKIQQFPQESTVHSY